MNQRITALFASFALLASTAAASAATFGVISAVGGTLRTTNWVSQTSTVASLQTMYLEVTLCSGAIEYPPFVPSGAGSVTAVGSCYSVTATVILPNQTEFTIVHTGDVNGVKTMSIGTVNSQSAFDRSAPAPGTAGSGSGFDISPVVMVGAWTVDSQYSNLVKLVGAAPVGDLFCTLSLSFSSCFDVGDVFTFRADTDRIN